MSQTTRPYFIWDYDLPEADLHQILRGEAEQAKIWVVIRLLESARYEDIWKYITLAELLAIFPRLQLKPLVRAVWEYALNVWGKQTNENPLPESG